MKIAIGADHRGFILKNGIIEAVEAYDWVDVGSFEHARSDYPEFANLVTDAILSGKVDLGILLCGSGIGMAIAANRHKEIYAGLCWNAEVAKAAREDDNVNVLVLPADFISHEQAIAIVYAWLGATFKGGHYQQRLDMIDE